MLSAMFAWVQRVIASSPQAAAGRADDAAGKAQKMPSHRPCMTSRAVEAPSASRTAVSRIRSLARAVSSVVTLTSESSRISAGEQR